MECASALASSNVGGQLHANELGTGDEKNKGKGGDKLSNGRRETFNSNIQFKIHTLPIPWSWTPNQWRTTISKRRAFIWIESHLISIPTTWCATITNDDIYNNTWNIKEVQRDRESVVNWMDSSSSLKKRKNIFLYYISPSKRSGRRLIDLRYKGEVLSSFCLCLVVVVVVDAVCVSVQYPALALLQLPYRLRRGGAEENARRGVTLSNKKKKKERKKRRRKERGEL